jgi:8-oxo-dGTP pyrophosphatase MutT (NUDIX family)
MDIVERRAARVLLVADGAVLLIQGQDPSRPELGPWWHTPGGGIEADERVEAAAAREVDEETGLRLDPDALGPCVATRRTTFEFDHRRYQQDEWFYAVEVERFEPHGAGWIEIERRSLLRYGWWTPDELDATSDVVFPRELAAVVRAVIAGAITEPFRLSSD